MRAHGFWILFAVAACGNESGSGAPEAKVGGAPVAKGEKVGIERYTHRDPTFTIDLGKAFEAPDDQGTQQRFKGVAYGSFLAIRWADFRFGQDAAKELERQLALFRDDPAPKGPIVAEGKLAAGGGAWIERQDKLTPGEHHVVALLIVGKQVVECMAHGAPEVAAACKTLRP